MYYKNQTVVYHNGKWERAKEAKAGLYNQTMHYGNGVFEGIRSYQTEDGVRIFKAEEHFQRLLDSAKKMHIKFDYSVPELVELAYELLDKNELTDAYLRPLCYLGENMTLEPVGEVGFFMCAWEWENYLGTKLLRTTVSPFTRPHPRSCHIDAKTVGHYTNSILASTEAKNRGFDEALLLDVNGYLAEAPGANLFFEKDGVLYTPALGHILPGITRQTILELAQELELEVKEKHFKVAELKQADSAFFVGTAAEVVGLKSIDDYNFPLSWDHSLGNDLAHMYKQRVSKREYKHFELV
jgi:branched-chain amino acid aminotransferase